MKKDIANEETEKILEELEKKIRKEYTQATKEAEAKWKDYLERFEKKDNTRKGYLAKQLEEYNAGNISWKDYKKMEAEYQQWRIGQIAVGKRWEEMRDTLAEDLSTTYDKARSIAQGYMPEVYALNHNYATFQIEQESLVDTSYTLYSRDTVERLIRENPKLLPDARFHSATYEMMRDKEYKWDRQRITSAVTQGILQGESIPNLAKRMRGVAEMDYKASIRNARTSITSAQSAGRIEAYRRADDMGINVQKQWIATIDDRTRHEHRELDGQTIPIDYPFTVDGYEIMYPADPDAEPEMVYNCRCRMVSVIKGFEKSIQDFDIDERLGDMTYDEWKKSRDIKSKPIDAQERAGEAIKQQYINDYRRMAGQLPVYGEAKEDTIQYENQKPSSANAEERVQDNVYAELSDLKLERPKRNDYEDADEFYQAREQYKEDREKAKEIVSKWYDDNIGDNPISKEEFEGWCEKNGVVAKKVDGMDMTALRAYTERYEQLTSDFPIVMEWNNRNGFPFEIEFMKDKMWDAEASHGMAFGAPFSEQLGYKDVCVSKMLSTIGGGFVQGQNPAVAVFDHEFGHQVYFAMTGYAEMDKTKEQKERIAEIKKDVLALAGKKGMSEYATTNDDELFAEAFCAWYGGEQTEFAQGMGNLLKKWGVI